MFIEGNKYYFEIKIVSGGELIIGVCRPNFLLGRNKDFTTSEYGWGLRSTDGYVYMAGDKYKKAVEIEKDDIIGVMLNMIDGEISF